MGNVYKNDQNWLLERRGSRPKYRSSARNGDVVGIATSFRRVPVFVSESVRKKTFSDQRLPRELVSGRIMYVPTTVNIVLL